MSTPATSTPTGTPIPYDDPRDARLALRATGLLRTFNDAGVLSAADVHVAQRLGMLGGEPDEEVLLAVALAVRAVRAGSVCLELARVPELTPLPDLPAADLAWPDPAAWHAAVESSALVGHGALRLDGDLLYLDRYWQEETQVVADLGGARTGTATPDPDLAAVLDRYFPGEGFADQRAAAATACDQATSVVTGGPGTGKTTTIARLLGVLLDRHAAGPRADQPLRVALAAPTGKAAARMAQALAAATGEGFPGADAGPGDPAWEHLQVVRGLRATTLHRLLGWRPDNRTRFRHHRGNRLPHDVVVVDETSMVSLTMMARLLEAVRPEARLVLVGDADQLASVDAGAVLKDLVDGLESRSPSPVARLTASRRFGHRIGTLAEAVRAGDADRVVDLLAHGDDEVSWLPAEELPDLVRDRALSLRTAAASGDVRRALAELDHHRLLCAHRDGPAGVGWWNRQVEGGLREALGVDHLDRWYVGQPVIVNSNDYGLGLFNGDTGVLCEVDGALVAVVGDESTPDPRRLPTTRLADVSTAHAMTVHRSQGSQFREVTVLLPEEDSLILSRELLYTAVTRAERRVRVVGSEASVRAAVTRRAQRATGLARRGGGQ